MIKYNSVQEYLDSQPEKTREVLRELRDIITKVVPSAKELINYNIPAYSLIDGGKRDQQIMIAGYEKHVGLYPHPMTIEKFEKDLKYYKKGKGSVQFPLNKPLPSDLIEKMIKFRFEILKKKVNIENNTRTR